jgi:hypothetical protein
MAKETVYSQTKIANASMPSTFQEIDVSSNDFTITTSGEQQDFQIFVGVSGDVEAVGVDDSSAVVFKNVPEGTFLPGWFKEVKSANTTATDIVVSR